MLKSRWLLIVLVVACIALIVLFLQLPKQPHTALEKVQSVDADSLKLAQAIELVNGEDPMQGITLMREILAKDSTNVDAQFYMGMFSVRSGQLDKAIKRFETVVQLRPADVRYLVEVGYQYMRMDSLKRALGCFDKALQIEPSENNSLFFSAKANEGLGNLEEAKRNYQTLLTFVTDSVVADTVKQYIINIDKKLNP